MSDKTQDEGTLAVDADVAEGRGTVYATSSVDTVGTTDANATETAKRARVSDDTAAATTDEDGKDNGDAEAGE